jgi:hypothetical protein
MKRKYPFLYQITAHKEHLVFYSIAIGLITYFYNFKVVVGLSLLVGGMYASVNIFLWIYFYLRYNNKDIKIMVKYLIFLIILFMMSSLVFEAKLWAFALGLGFWFSILAILFVLNRK